MSIIHLDYLRPEEFLEVVENLQKYSASLKEDGASLQFGISGGRVYVSRESKTKDAKRCFTTGDFDNTVDNQQFQAALLALQFVQSKLSVVMKEGDVVQIEVMFGEFPNVYQQPNSRIVFLKTIKGDENLPDQLEVLLKDQPARVDMTIMVSTDGINLTREKISDTFTFSAAKHFSLTKVVNDPIFKMLVARLKNAVMNRRTTDESQHLYHHQQTLVKMRILEVLVGDPDSVEGIVIYDKNVPANQFKIVNREYFTVVNKFFQSGRKMVRGQKRNSSAFDTLENRGGVLTIVIDRLKETLDEGESQKIALENTKSALASILRQGQKMLRTKSAEYISSPNVLELGDKNVDVPDAVKRKTQTVFAEGQKTLYDIAQKIKAANSYDEIRAAFE